MKIIKAKDVEELQNVTIVDVRDSYSFEYGHIKGAINIPEFKLMEQINMLDKSKSVVICSKNGEKNENILSQLELMGYDLIFVEGGYYSWLDYHYEQIEKENINKQVEESLRKRFKKEIFSKFAKAINEYDLIKPNDKIAVCISGGKDSMLMAKLFQELKRHNKFNFELVFLVMDPGYSENNKKLIEKNCKVLDIPAHIFKTNIFDSVYSIEKSPCYICARMRRGNLYSKAKELGCNKIALGHHYDDVIETILMGMLYGAQIQTMMPKLHSENFEGMELIRPLYLIRESDIIRWRDYNQLHFLQCACKFTEMCALEDGKNDVNLSSKRKKVKNIIKNIKKDDPQIEFNIFKSVENVNLSTVVAYKDKHNKKHHFLDEYDK